MAVWSCLRSNTIKLFKDGLKNAPNQLRFMSGGHDHHRVMEIRASPFQWQKVKDSLHFYALLGLIPVGLLVFYANVFIGPAALSEMPEDYTPKYWEYYRHPITRFLAQYVYTSPQQEYEKYLHKIFEEDEKIKIRKLEKKVLALMSERKDYQAFYYIPVDGKYHRIVRKQSEEFSEVAGWTGPKEGPPF